MMGGYGLFDMQALVDVGDRHLPIGIEQVYDGDADGMGDGPQRLRRILKEVLVKMCLHPAKLAIYARAIKI